MKFFISYLSKPSAFICYQLLIISLLGFQLELLLKTGLTNPEGTATILKSIPYHAQKVM